MLCQQVVGVSVSRDETFDNHRGNLETTETSRWEGRNSKTFLYLQFLNKSFINTWRLTKTSSGKTSTVIFYYNSPTFTFINHITPSVWKLCWLHISQKRHFNTNFRNSEQKNLSTTKSFWFELSSVLLTLIHFNENLYLLFFLPGSKIQKQPSRDVPKKRCSQNMQEIYRRIPMPKCDFNLRLYWNRTSAWVFSYNFAAYFQNIFS